MKPSLLIAVSHGMHVRNLLDSSILEDLKRDFHIVIVSHERDEAFLRTDYGGPHVDISRFVRTPALFEERYTFIRRHILSNPRRNRTPNLFGMSYRQKQPILYPITIGLNRLLGSSLAMRRCWLALERALIPGTEYDGLLRRYQPVAVVTANYGITADDIRLIRAARRASIPSIAVVPSWDNLSSKGVMGAPPDKLLVWNEIMRSEAVDLHDYRPEDVVVCGGVQFDAYGDKNVYGTRAEFCHALGMDPQRKFVVYGTITPVYFPYNVRLVEMLAQASQSGEFGEPIQVLVRLHPQVVHDATFGDDIGAYNDVAQNYPGTVFLDVPKVRVWNQMTPPDRTDGPFLGAMLHHADACVVPGSTLALDSVANGTPVVGIAFDGDAILPYGQSIRRWYDFSYYKPLLDMGGLELARSRDEMVVLLKRMLSDKCANAEARARVVENFLGWVDGKAGVRAAAAIRAWARPSSAALA